MLRFKIFLMIFCVVLNVRILNAAGEWRTDSALINTPRFGASAVTLNGYIYVLGGTTINGIVLNTMERFDPVTKTWDDDVDIAPPFDTPRVDATAIVLNGKIYLIGGQDDEEDVLDKVEEYDPASNSWHELSETREKRRGAVAAPVFDTICLMGGLRESNDYEEKIEWYDIANSKWEQAQSNWNLPRFKPFLAAIDDKLYLFGGIFNVPENSGFIGDVTPDWEITWRNSTSLQITRGNGATAVLSDSIFMIGGINSNGASSDFMEIYDVSSQQLLPAPSLPIPRAAAAAAVLDGEIYVIGGYSDSPEQPLASVEIFSPLTALNTPDDPLPSTFALMRGFPNPFNGTVQIEINIPKRGEHSLTLYDLQGRKVKTLHNGSLTSGKHSFEWNAVDDQNNAVSTGIYLAILQSNQNLRKLKVVYVK